METATAIRVFPKFMFTSLTKISAPLQMHLILMATLGFAHSERSQGAYLKEGASRGCSRIRAVRVLWAGDREGCGVAHHDRAVARWRYGHDPLQRRCCPAGRLRTGATDDGLHRLQLAI